jgi:hypothetical protein
MCFRQYKGCRLCRIACRPASQNDWGEAKIAYVTDFVRDPRTGGCAAGVSPANLGFRLVVERGGSYPIALLEGALRLFRLG